ncbi:universal stress protein [Nocardia rhamnosiphila]|uniref:universal stress protein n=1 Tax=Nocardia rhamnosiphila TaxID=426716 RepID=UPI0033FC07E0
MPTHSEPAVVVGIDGSSASFGALAWAALEAELRRAPMRLVYAVGAPVDSGPAVSAVFDRAAMRAEGEAILRTAEKTVRATVERPDDLDIETTVADPPPALVLVDHSEGALMIVVGTTGCDATGRTLLGSVSDFLAHHAHCPVAVVPQTTDVDPGRPPGPVVVGVDGSADCVRAIDTAFDEAARRRTNLVAVTVWSELFRYVSRDEIAGRAQAVQSECLAGHSEQYPDIEVVRVVDEDLPARRLLEEADRGRLLVVGARGNGGFAGTTLGSVVRAVLHGAATPVIVARPRA